MDFIKKWFNKVIGWIAYPIAKAQDTFTEYLGPAIVHLRGQAQIKWDWKCVGKCALGILLIGLTAATIAVAGVLTIVGLTLLLALILPSLLANTIAVLLTIKLMYEVYQSVKEQTADEIVIEVEEIVA